MNLISGIQWQHTKSALTSISNFSLLSEVVTMQQTGSTADKLKPRLFHKSAQFWVHLADFHPSVNHAWYWIELWNSMLKLAKALWINKEWSRKWLVYILFPSVLWKQYVFINQHIWYELDMGNHPSQCIRNERLKSPDY